MIILYLENEIFCEVSVLLTGVISEGLTITFRSIYADAVTQKLDWV